MQQSSHGHVETPLFDLTDLLGLAEVAEAEGHSMDEVRNKKGQIFLDFFLEGISID